MKQLKEKKPYFMMAQLPFNTTETEELNITYYDEDRERRDQVDIEIMIDNLFELGELSIRGVKGTINFLDVGFGTGYLIERLCKIGLGNYYGIEPIKSVFDKTKEKLDYLKNNVDIIETKWSTQYISASMIGKYFLENTDLENYNPGIKFDYIHSFYVLEHMVNPLVMFEKSRELLEENGKLIITCPNNDGYVPQVYKSRHAIKSHRWLPGKKILFRILKDYGFEIEKYFTYGGFPAPRTKTQNIANNLFKKFNLGDVICFLVKKI